MQCILLHASILVKLASFHLKTSCVDHKDRNDMWPTAAAQFPQQFPSYSNRKCKKSPFSRTAAHIFVSPGDAPVIITQYAAWIERQFDACQNRSHHVPIYVQ